MISKKEKEKWLIENFTNKKGEIDLSKLNFGKRNVLLNGIKTKGNIDNYNQDAFEIDNYGQKAKHRIDNSWQESKEGICNADQKSKKPIDNRFQKANEINNSFQEAIEIYNTNQKVIIEHWNKIK